jgi:hypothetical protein
MSGLAISVSHHLIRIVAAEVDVRDAHHANNAG